MLEFVDRLFWRTHRDYRSGRHLIFSGRGKDEIDPAADLA
jgi:hypothetical protein